MPNEAGAAGAQPPALRLSTPEDAPFIERLFGATLSLPPELVALQWRAFKADRQRNYPDLVTEIIVAGRDPVGYLFSEEPEPGILHIVDIAVLPGYQGRGIGSAVLAEKLRHCTRAMLHVNLLNRAQTLYGRLGFEITGQSGPLLRMEYRRR